MTLSFGCSPTEGDMGLYGDVKEMNVNRYKAYARDNLQLYGKLISSKSYEFNKKRQIKSEKYYGKNNFTYEYEYNDDGLLIRKTKYNKILYILYKNKYKYSDDGELLMLYHQSIIPHQSYTKRYEYNNGMAVKEIKYNSDGVISRESTFEYNNSKQIVKKEVYYDKELLSYFTYHYNEDKELVWESHYSAHERLVSTSKYRYNTYGENIGTFIYEDECNNEKEFYLYDYVKYDDLKNWIERVTYKELEVIIESREITYR